MLGCFGRAELATRDRLEDGAAVRTRGWRGAILGQRRAGLGRGQAGDDLVELGPHGRVGDAEPLLDLAEVAPAGHEEPQKRALLLGQTAEVAGLEVGADLGLAPAAAQLADLELPTATGAALEDFSCHWAPPDLIV